jgi:cytochrome c-type biogenesis protein CcmH
MVFLLVICALVALPAFAQENTTPIRVVSDDEVNAIAQKLYCPVCENITLDTCGTAACADWRYEIRLQLEAGMTEQQIVEDFVRRFGDRVVGTPLDPTLRAVSLVTPWLVIAGALIAVAVVLVKRQRPQPLPIATDTAPTNRYQDLFEQDIRNT